MRILLTILNLILVGATMAQGNHPTADKSIDAAQRQAVIEGAIIKLRESYVFPDVAKQMETALRERLQRKEYDGITSAAVLARTLSGHLQAVSKDRHLNVMFTGNGPSVFDHELNPEQHRAMAKANNYSFEKVERLSGNIGYLDLRLFEDPELAAETASAAMTFLANTDALIIDLRQNGGGHGEMVAFLASYLFDKKTHLNDVYNRYENRTEEFWTKETVPGKKFGAEKPVFVLTSRFSFSGAEEFAYNLQALKRGTIIGEVTGGGAHPVAPHIINQDFIIGVPYARSINPITKTNWEGVGVKPDVATPAAHALKTAHLAALKAVQAKTTDPRLIAQLQRSAQTIQRELDALKNPQTSTAQTAPPPQSEMKLPNTPAGKTFGEFLAAFNSGKLDMMKKFHTDHGGNPDNADQDMGFYNQSGGLKIHSVKKSTDTEIEVLAQMKKTEQWVNFTIAVDAQAPHGIADLRIQPAAPPSAEATKPLGKPSEPPAKKLSRAETIQELQKYLQKLSAEDSFSGAVLIAENGQPWFKQSYGLADRSAKTPNKTDTKFNLGSMNKMFTAVAIAQLVEKGKLSYDDKVGKLLPDFPNKAVAEKVTVHHLLTHTAGLGSFWNKKFDHEKTRIKTVNDYLALFVNDPLLFEPGARFEYSNAGFVVLGAIIEKVSGQNYYDYVRANIYKPAGMTNSDCYENNEAVANLATGYTVGNEEQSQKVSRRENTDTRPNRGGPAGGGYSTVEDLLNFHLALRDNKLISAKSLQLLTTAKTKMGQGGYGYGFGEFVVQGKRFFGHNGGAPGIAAELRMFPELGVTIAVMSNYDPPMLMPVVRKITEMITAE